MTALANNGSTAWHVIEAGKPSASLASNACAAIPGDATDPWHDLTDARGPNTLVWQLSQTNEYGVDVVDVAFGLRWEYGARFAGGGAYIPICYLYVPRCNIGWGYTLDVSLNVHDPVNAGTDGAPVARLPLTMTGTVGSLLGSEPVRWDFTLDGDGAYQVT
jgi:hypothetical protein